jgi:choloylglycine hydrolase
MKPTALLLGFALLAGFAPTEAKACTRFLWNDGEKGVFAIRTMDWFHSTDPLLYVLPRGMERHGGRMRDYTVVRENPAQWTSRYGSVVTTMYGAGSADGLNEKGLAMQVLFLGETNYGARDVLQPGVHAAL